MDFKDKYKNFSPDDLVNFGLLEPAHKSGYICPFCNNGSGENGTGVDWKLLTGGYVGHCFKCDSAMDVFSVIAHKYNLDVRADFYNVMQKAKEIFGDSNSAEKKDSRSFAIEQLIRNSQNYLHTFIKSSYRGINLDIYKKFHCGYVKNWFADNTPRLIIPTSYKHYLARYVGDENSVPPNCKIKQHQGSKDIFGFKFALRYDKIFITEGEFDAMSFWQIELPAISFCGSDITKTQQALFKSISAEKKFIICYDNDDTGLLKAQKVRDILVKFNFTVAIAYLPDNYNDVNDFLQADEVAFKSWATDTYNNISFAQIITQDKPVNKPVNKPAENKVFEIDNAPIELIMPPHFYVNNDSVTYESNKGNFIVCDKPVLVTKKTLSMNHDNMKVELAVKDTGVWYKHLLNRADIADPRKLYILADWGVNINFENAKFMSKYLGELISNNESVIPTVLTVKQPGWIDKCEQFIYPDNKGSVTVDSDFDYESRFISSGDKNIWFNLFADCLKDSLIFRTTLGFILAAPLVKICHTRNAQLALIAPSGRGKSAVVELAMAVFGNPLTLKNTFNGTSNFIDSISSKFNDLPCWIDEFQSAVETTRKNIQQSVYNYDNGMTKGRMNKLAEHRPVYNFSGTRVMTAEQNILQVNSTQGAAARLIELHCKYVINENTAREIHTRLKENYGFYGKAWIDFIVEHADDIRNFYKMYLAGSRQILIAELGEYMPSNIEAIALAHTALKFFIQLIKKDFPTLDFDADKQLVLDFSYLADDYLPTRSETSMTRKAESFLRELAITHDKYFRHYNFEKDKPDNFDSVRELDYHDSTLSPTLGVKFRDGRIGFYPKAINRKLLDEGYPDAKTVFGNLFDDRLLDCGNDKIHLYQKRPRINDRQEWLYILKNNPAE